MRYQRRDLVHKRNLRDIYSDRQRYVLSLPLFLSVY
jgi:hypothetical protein